MKKISIIAIITVVIGIVYQYYLTTQPLDLTGLTSSKTEKDYWIVKEKHYFDIPSELIDLKLSACIMLQYDINKQGKLENPVIIGHVAGDLIKDEYIASMKKWRWEPSESNTLKQPIRWVRYYGFGIDEQSIRSKCMNSHIITLIQPQISNLRFS